ncbi:MAG: DUF2460 domain-containing protein [Parcubacteria group bacterium]|nr:DUF2460 domain-containing protein [Parcubacteria group bacterium]
MATFTWTPQKVFTYGSNFKTLVSKFDSGKEQRRKKWTAKKRGFHLEMPTTNLTDTAAILAFFEAREGQYDPFTWTNPLTSVLYTNTIRFDADSLVIHYRGPNMRQLEFDFIEII